MDKSKRNPDAQNTRGGQIRAAFALRKCSLPTEGPKKENKQLTKNEQRNFQRTGKRRATKGNRRQRFRSLSHTLTASWAFVGVRVSVCLRTKRRMFDERFVVAPLTLILMSESHCLPGARLCVSGDCRVWCSTWCVREKSCLCGRGRVAVCVCVSLPTRARHI